MTLYDTWASERNTKLTPLLQACTHTAGAGWKLSRRGHCNKTDNTYRHEGNDSRLRARGSVMWEGDTGRQGDSRRLETTWLQGDMSVAGSITWRISSDLYRNTPSTDVTHLWSSWQITSCTSMERNYIFKTNVFEELYRPSISEVWRRTSSCDAKWRFVYMRGVFQLKLRRWISFPRASSLWWCQLSGPRLEEKRRPSVSDAI